MKTINEDINHLDHLDVIANICKFDDVKENSSSLRKQIYNKYLSYEQIKEKIDKISDTLEKNINNIKSIPFKQKIKEISKNRNKIELYKDLYGYNNQRILPSYKNELYMIPYLKYLLDITDSLQNVENLTNEIDILITKLDQYNFEEFETEAENIASKLDELLKQKK